MEKENKFAETLKSLLKNRGITLETLAHELGTTRQAIHQYTSGKTYPKYDTLIKIADFLDVSTDYLLTGITPIKATSKLLKLSEEAVKNIMALSPDEALALSDSFSDSFTEDFEDFEDSAFSNPYKDKIEKITPELMDIQTQLNGFKTMMNKYFDLCSKFKDLVLEKAESDN